MVADLEIKKVLTLKKYNIVQPLVGTFFTPFLASSRNYALKLLSGASFKLTYIDIFISMIAREPRFEESWGSNWVAFIGV